MIDALLWTCMFYSSWFSLFYIKRLHAMPLWWPMRGGIIKEFLLAAALLFCMNKNYRYLQLA